MLDETHHARAFQGCLEAIPPKTCHMEEDIARNTVIGKDEAEALGHIEPLDAAGNFSKVGIAAFTSRIKASPRVPARPVKEAFSPIRMPPFFKNTPQLILDISD